MIRTIIRPLLALTIAAVAFPALGAAQASTNAPAPAELQSWFTEMQEVHTQLEEIQRQALQDRALAAQQEELGAAIQAAMAAEDPGMAERMERIGSIDAEAMEAQQSGDQQRIQSLMGEAQQIQERFMATQEAVLARPEIAGQLEAFQTALESRMIEVDPDAAALIERFRELEERIAAVMGG